MGLKLPLLPSGHTIEPALSLSPVALTAVIVTLQVAVLLLAVSFSAHYSVIHIHQ